MYEECLTFSDTGVDEVVVERIQSKDEHVVGKRGIWKANPGTVGKGRIQTAYFLRIGEHEILQGVEDDMFKDEICEEL